MSSQKRLLRTQIRKVLSAISSQSIDLQSNLVCQRVLQMPEWKQSKNICLYLNMPKAELRTNTLLSAAFEQGKRVFIPKCLGPHYMEMFELESPNIQLLPKNNWGIPEPAGDTAKVMENGIHCDLIIVPALAFDTAFARLGHGKGFYDAFLRRYSTWCTEKSIQYPLHKVGICLQEQWLSSRVIPIEPTGCFHWHSCRTLLRSFDKPPSVSTSEPKKQASANPKVCPSPN
ncbi:5-formyltetrahydrofolate cyclo-ligase [Schizosaccharomyces japonicus yFS275]|uniref:5-formyltetrahydrofolate cyclo-ligase n=1 Tax=Schizosaccharomyces japonicus (strain yFS275 / FY16936) TaxID=402676 RepID=B6JYF4_SCHJY|nr:5-formyltetrahydrofolate cyclo-ligase [Schizosaccharomyces japonicus yFS275]EEB06572.2 5-formyltetrahydrofolate cyclo-ligase [Schizosaccharomyces japonicus yFS275]